MHCTAQCPGYLAYAPWLFKTGILQFHESVYTMSAEVLRLSVKLRGDHFLNVCIYCEVLTFACLLHWPKHMIVTGQQVWTVGGCGKSSH